MMDHLMNCRILLCSALRTGLALEQEFGANPYRFGLIGSTDSHTGLATAEEPNFWGKFATDSTIAGAMRSTAGMEYFGWAMSASGLAAVWAEDNTREAILQAFKRRQVYATTGPRIAVQVYAGTGFATRGDSGGKEADLEIIRARGVPMGGELSALSAPPSFYVHAAKDPKSAHLDRIQVVKGWLDRSETFEQVYDVAWSGERSAGAGGQIPAVPDTVDPKTGSYSNEHGATSLSALWTDPDFDAGLPAFYYVRVLEIPTPRHSTLDAIAIEMEPEDTGYPVSIQERAYTSPIHYRP